MTQKEENVKYVVKVANTIGRLLPTLIFVGGVLGVIKFLK